MKKNQKKPKLSNTYKKIGIGSKKTIYFFRLLIDGGFWLLLHLPYVKPPPLPPRCVT